MAQGAMTTMGVGGSTPATFAYDKRRLDRLVNSFYFMGFGEEKTLPGGMGASISFRRFNNLSAATTPLNEGVTPAGSAISKADLTATVYQYGDFVTYTDWIDMVGVDGKVVKIIDDLQVDQIADTFDQLIRDIISANGTIRYADGSSVVETATVPTTADFEYIINYMERRNVKYIKEKVLPGVQVGTKGGLDPAYIAFTHPDLRSTYEAMTGFVKVSEYPAGAKVLDGEFGQFKRVKFVATTNAKVVLGAGASGTSFRNTASAYDVYYTTVIGAKAYGNVRLQGGSVKTIIKPLGYKDELDQQGSVGWKMAFGGLVLDSNRVHNIVSTTPILA